VLATCLLAGLLNYSSTLKMEAIRSSETSGATQHTTLRHIPEDDTLLIDVSSALSTATLEALDDDHIRRNM
jgi:hypothetical protein